MGFKPGCRVGSRVSNEQPMLSIHPSLGAFWGVSQLCLLLEGHWSVSTFHSGKALMVFWFHCVLYRFYTPGTRGRRAEAPKHHGTSCIFHEPLSWFLSTQSWFDLPKSLSSALLANSSGVLCFVLRRGIFMSLSLFSLLSILSALYTVTGKSRASYFFHLNWMNQWLYDWYHLCN